MRAAPDTQVYHSQLHPYEPTHPPMAHDVLWAFVDAYPMYAESYPSTLFVNPNTISHVLEFGFDPISRAKLGFRVIEATQTIEKVLREHPKESTVWVWLCQVLPGATVGYWNATAFHPAEERLDQFDSLMCSLKSSADEEYHEILLRTRHQVLPVWLFAVTGV